MKKKKYSRGAVGEHRCGEIEMFVLSLHHRAANESGNEEQTAHRNQELSTKKCETNAKSALSASGSRAGPQSVCRCSPQSFSELELIMFNIAINFGFYLRHDSRVRFDSRGASIGGDLQRFRSSCIAFIVFVSPLLGPDPSDRRHSLDSATDCRKLECR